MQVSVISHQVDAATLGGKEKKTQKTKTAASLVCSVGDFRVRTNTKIQ